MNKKHITFIALAAALIIVEAAIFLMGRQIKATPATVSASPADSATQDATTTAPEGWQVYHNDAYGFGFAYPPDWGVFEQSTATQDSLTLGLGVSGMKGDFVAWVDVSPGDDIDAPINADIKRYAKSLMSSQEKTLFLDGIKGKLIHYFTDGQDPESARWVYVKRGPDIFKIGITVDVSPYDEQFDQILTTFMFLK